MVLILPPLPWLVKDLKKLNKHKHKIAKNKEYKHNNKHFQTTTTPLHSGIITNWKGKKKMFSNVGNLIRNGIRDAVSTASCDAVIEVPQDNETSPHKVPASGVATLKGQGLESGFGFTFCEKTKAKGSVQVKARKGVVEFNEASISLVGEVQINSGLIPATYPFLHRKIVLEKVAEPEPEPTPPPPLDDSASPTPTPAPTPKRPTISETAKTYEFDFGTLWEVAESVAKEERERIIANAKAKIAVEQEEENTEPTPTMRALEKFEQDPPQPPVLFETYTGSRVKIKYYIEFVLHREGVLNADVKSKLGIFARLESSNLDRSKCPSLFAMKGIAKESDTLWDKPYHVYNRTPITEREPEAKVEKEKEKEKEEEKESEGGEEGEDAGSDSSSEVVGGAYPQRKGKLSSSISALKALAQFAEAPASTMPLICTSYADVHEQPLKMQLVLDSDIVASVLFERNVYHCKDIVKGRVFFDGEKGKYNNCFSIADCHLQLYRKEVQNLADGGLSLLSQESLFKSEIVDGVPNLREVVPLSLPLRGIANLGPSQFRVAGRASVNYFLRLTVVCSITKDDVVTPMTCFTESEVILWRLPVGK